MPPEKKVNSYSQQHKTKKIPQLFFIKKINAMRYFII